MTSGCDRLDLAEIQPGRPHFEAVLYPNNSLGGAGFALLMAGIVLVSALIGAGFFMIGAWPVTGFLGLDVVLLYAAFRYHFRQTRRADLVRIDEQGLTVRRILPGGDEQSWRFETAWVQVVEENRQLVLRSHGKQLAIGGFLTVDERRALIRALTAALRAYRDGPTGAKETGRGAAPTG